MDDRKTYLVRLGLPDRPGALGSIASRFGALKGDVVGLEIVERRTGVAIDELVVSLPDDVPVGLVIKELSAEEGVEVEDIRPLDRLPYDPRLHALEVASIILGPESRRSWPMACASTWAGPSARRGPVSSTGGVGSWRRGAIGRPPSRRAARARHPSRR